MVKKIVLGSLLVGFVGVLIYGAVLRTNAKTSSGGAEGIGTGTGLGRGRAITTETTDVAVSRGQGQDQGAGKEQEQGDGGRGQGSASGEQTGAALSTADELTYQGVAVTVNSTELAVEAGDNELILVEGRAWAYALEQGIDVQVEHTIIITGFVEDGEFKAISLENLTTGQYIPVRDASGRPLWSGGRGGGA